MRVENQYSTDTYSYTSKIFFIPVITNQPTIRVYLSFSQFSLKINHVIHILDHKVRYA